MSSPSPEVTAAIGGLLQADAARVVALAARLKGPGRSITSTVQGASMGSALPSGSRIRIALTGGEHHELGQVIAFLSDGHVVVHRIVHRCASGRSAGHVLTRGDATLVPDPPVAYAHILGPVSRAAEGVAPLVAPSVAPIALPVRSVHAAVVSWLLLRATIGLLHLGPAPTTTVLTVAYRSVTRCRAGVARWRGRGRSAPVRP